MCCRKRNVFDLFPMHLRGELHPHHFDLTYNYQRLDESQEPLPEENRKRKATPIGMGIEIRLQASEFSTPLEKHAVVTNTGTG